MKMHRPALALLVSAGMTGAALAGGKSTQLPEPLPGVSQPPDIVTTLPPEPSDGIADAGHFKIGDTEVRISGSVRIDVTAGNLPKPR